MTERDLQLAVVSHWRSSLVVACPNYTPRRWWECDVWGVTKAGYWVEWECKVSRADLRADATKQYGGRRKHEVITTDDDGPSRFWFVVPDELEVQPEEVPPWAGLATVETGLRWNRTSIIKPAPLLGRRKSTRLEIRLAERRMWFRYWNCLREMNNRGIAEPSEEVESKETP